MADHYVNIFTHLVSLRDEFLIVTIVQTLNQVEFEKLHLLAGSTPTVGVLAGVNFGSAFRADEVVAKRGGHVLRRTYRLRAVFPAKRRVTVITMAR